MRQLGRLLCLLAVTALPSIAIATTWIQTTVRDPITGTPVKVSEPGSYGSYIYHWPGKEDQVFWPYTDENWLWFSPRSGFIAFGGDFGKLEPSARERLKTWLANNYSVKQQPRTRLELLRWAEQVYAVRGMDEEF